MKRTSLALILLASTGTAVGQSPGGFHGPSGVRVSTAAEIPGLPDDSHVQVTGYLVRSLGGDEYEFQDDTGTLIVEIDDDQWGGIEADPATRLQLTGELDIDPDKVELEVERVALAP
ncbi:MAG: YgiW/YdeI family stress tolerance OB fold protein [Pseudomonadales bacterium]